MSTSDINKKQYLTTFFIYLLFTIFCMIFSFIYLKLSYGVVSKYMKYLAVIPFALGCLVYILLYRFDIIKMRKVSYNFYNAGIFTLTVGSAVKGIFSIAGAYSNLIKFYFIIGILFLILSLIINIKDKNIKKREA